MIAAIRGTCDPKWMITPDQFQAMSDADRAAFLEHAPDSSPMKLAIRLMAPRLITEMNLRPPTLPVIDEEN